MDQNLISSAAVTVQAPAEKVWEALTRPELIKQYMFGAEILTDWKEGSPVVYKGTYQGKSYEDKGRLVKVQPPNTLVMTHWSPLSGTPDTPENYHTVNYQITAADGGTRVTITQDKNASPEEQQQSAGFWQTALDKMKEILESGTGQNPVG